MSDQVVIDPAPSAPGKDATMTELAKAYAALATQKSALEAELNRRKKILDEIEPILSEKMIDEGVQNLSIDGRLIYRIKRLSVGPKEGVDRETFTTVLEQVGLRNCVTYLYQSLKAVITDWTERGVPVPEPLDSVLRVEEEYTLGCRKS